VGETVIPVMWVLAGGEKEVPRHGSIGLHLHLALARPGRSVAAWPRAAMAGARLPPAARPASGGAKRRGGQHGHRMRCAVA